MSVYDMYQMSSFTPSQKRAYAIKMAAARKSAARSVRGYGAYSYKKAPASAKKRAYTKAKSYAKATPSAIEMDYPGVGTAIGGAIGSIFGPVGAAVGAGLGTGAHALLKHVTGFGEYRVARNSLLSLKGNSPPIVRNVSRGEATVITHREYIGDIISSGSSGGSGTAFNLQSFTVQPGNIQTFPWLSQVAANFQEYEINGMLFEFKSLSSDAVATSNTSAALGSLIMATNYNPGATNFSNKQEMLESEFSSDTKPSMSILHPIECKRSVTPVSHLYVRTGAVPSGQDIRLYDFANFQIASQGCQATNALLGELWVTYQISFYKAFLGGVVSGLDLPTDKFQLTACASAHPLGTSNKLVTGSSIGCVINAAGTTITFPNTVNEGVFLILIAYDGSSASCSPPSFSATSGSTYLQIWSSASGPDLSSNASSAAATTSTFHCVVMLSIGPNPALPVVVTLGTGGVLPTSAYGDLVITEINSNIVT